MVPPGANEQPAHGFRAGTRTVGTGRPRFKTTGAGKDAFSAVFESSGEALLLTDSTGVIHRVNARAQQLLGLREANTRGINLGTVLAEQSGARVLLLCDSANVFKPSTIDASLVTGHPIRLTLRAVLPDSHTLLLCVEEGADSHPSGAKVRQLEAELKSILESTPTGIIGFDSSGTVRFSNEQLGNILGVRACDLQPRKTAQEFRKLLAERLRNPEKIQVVSGALGARPEQRVDELEILRPERRVVQRISHPVLNMDRPAGWIELYADVTAETQIQSKMLQTEKMAAVGQLVSGIAHELNNPLTTIMGYAQLLLGHGLRTAQISEARKVYHEAERARRIVKNLLYFARESKPERGRVDINEIIERTVALRSYELKVENIAVRCNLARDLPKTMADPYQLQQVILNLLINAEQALVEGHGKGHVWIRTRCVSRRGTERIAIEVADDGPGIPAEISSRLFDPFFTTKPPGVGTGLGLSIVYGIVDKHEGEVTVESQPGRGAKFVVELPVVKPPIEPVRPFSRKALIRADNVPQGHILTIEDEPSVADLIVNVLREEGHQVEAVLDSKEGLARLSRGSYDLIICDLRMPDLDGPAFYDALVHAGSPMQNKVLFVTGDTLSPRTLEFLEPRNLPYLAKPFLVEELKLAVNRLLERPTRETRAVGVARRHRA